MTVADAPISETETAPPGRFAITRGVEAGVVLLAISAALLTYWTISTYDEPSGGARLPFGVLLLLNLVPLAALIVLIGRRIAKRRAEVGAMPGGGQLHIRLVAVFSLIASIPIVLTVLAASVMFQSGVEYWVSDRARNAFSDAIGLVQEARQEILTRWALQSQTMAADIAGVLPEYAYDTIEFQEYFRDQVFYRSLSEGVLFSYRPGNEAQTYVLVQPPAEADFRRRVTPENMAKITTATSVTTGIANDRIWAISALPGSTDLFLYVGTEVNAAFLNKQNFTAETIVADYEAIQDNSRLVYLQYNGALFAVALLIIAITIWIALAVADRLVRPVAELVGAARRVADGDLTARVTTPKSQDEIGTLATAFNTMTDQLQQQTNALVSANSQIESRRALIEAVMEGVTAGVVSVGADRSIRLINSSALSMLRAGEGTALGKPLSDVAPELDHLLDSDSREAIVQLTTGGDARTLAVKIASDGAGRILTFDDITQQLLDQRRAAWSDVARRIAHEIKNPLTPIQLAAERLQRRYGKQIDADDGTFARLTETIVRQVGDLRRMVDEFSSFARMPKPVFREESVIDLARQSLFLHEVAHPAIRFMLDQGEISPSLVCDRRQIGQALTNIVKNAVEAVEARGYEPGVGEISVRLSEGDEAQLLVEIADNGVGLPIERDRIVEPYMTTRARGTGLGLAIVKKIIDEHFGTIAFADRAGGGTVVTLCFDPVLLANMVGSDEDEGGAGEARPAMLTRNSNG